MTTTVKYYVSTQAGAPALTGQAGSLIALLDACLVDGFRLLSISSLTVASGVATLTCTTTHGYPLNSIILVAGATTSALNGEKRLTWVDSLTAKYDATGVPDQTATGTITAKLAPAGWGKPGAEANLGAYRGSAGNRHVLRVDDTGTMEARAVSAEWLTDIYTYGPISPVATQLSGGVYWRKSNTADGVARPWVLIADDRLMYLFASFSDTTGAAGYEGYVYGETSSLRADDAYHTLIVGRPATGSGVYAGSFPLLHSPRQDGHYWQRGISQFAGSARAGKSGIKINFNKLGSVSVSGYYNNITTGCIGSKDAMGCVYAAGDHEGYPAIPALVDGGFHVFSSPLLFDGEALAIRGMLAGCHQPLHDTNGNATPLSVITGVAGLAGRDLACIRVPCQGVAAPYHFIPDGLGIAAIDATGPWR